MRRKEIYGGSDSFGRRIFLYETVGRYQVLKNRVENTTVNPIRTYPDASIGVSCLKRIAVSANAAAGYKVIRCDFFELRIFCAAKGFVVFVAAF